MKIGIYTRVSTEEQAVHGVSLIAQENALMEYAKKHDYKVVDVYSDEGLSATTLDRQGLQRLLEDVRQGRIDLILITKLDRLSRGVANYYKIADVLESNNCGWKTILEDYDSTTASGRLHINIMLSVAENEAAVTKERINFVFQNKLDNGEIICGRKIPGYEIVDKHYKIVEEEAEMVRFVFDSYPKYLSYVKLTDAYNLKFGTNRDYHFIKHILQRKLYTGTYVHKGVEYKNFAPAIIDEDKFNQVQELIKYNARKPRKKNEIHILSMLVKCPHGKVMSVSETNMSYKTYTHVKCSKTNCDKWKNKTCKGVKGLQESVIESKILDNLASQLNNEYKLHVKKINNVSSETDYGKEIKKLKNKLSKLEDMYLDDMISKDKYTVRYKEYKDKLEYYSEKMLEDNNEATFKNVDDEFIKLINSSDFREMYNSLNDTKKHSFWANLVKEIRVDFNENYTLVFR